MLKDLQSEKDSRHISISRIGICDYKLPIALMIGDKLYNSICNITSTVALDETLRGAHLSRIIEVLNDSLYDRIITLEEFKKIVRETKLRSNTIGAEINFEAKEINPDNKKNDPDNKSNKGNSKILIIILPIFGISLIIILIVVILKYRKKSNSIDFERKTKNLKNEKLMEDI